MTHTVLKQMFNLASELAKRKTCSLQTDDDWQKIVREIIGVDPDSLVGKDAKSKQEQDRLETEIGVAVPNKDAVVGMYSAIAYAMQNKGYSSHNELMSKKKYKTLKAKLDRAKEVPSTAINVAINKCLNYIRILSHHYIFNLMMLESQIDVGEAAMADYRKFVSEQESDTGDMSEARAELRVVIDKFIRR